MKIGVTTFLSTKSNYGQVLQAYALQTVLKGWGHEAYVIKESINGFPFWLRVKGWVEKCLSPKQFFLAMQNGKGAVEEKHDRQFDKFISNNISVWPQVCKSLSEVKNNSSDFDALITGSDQVWNKYMTKEKHSFYLLQFGKEDCKRISYAASFGRDSLYIHEKSYFRKALSGFKLVTVRESTGKRICDKIGIESTIVADPVALLTREDWKKIAYGGEDIEVKDIKNAESAFTYMIANSNGESSCISPIVDHLKSKGKKVTYVSASRFRDELTNAWPTIPEWIRSINEASVVITDSFHCTLFSIILNTPFVVIPREGSSSAMNNRITTLLDTCGLKSRFVTDSDAKKLDTLLATEINWKEVNGRLSTYRSFSVNLLQSNL